MLPLQVLLGRTAVIEHTIASHNIEHTNFSMRRYVLDDEHGTHTLKSIHFPTKISELSNKLKEGLNPVIREDGHECKIIFKRVHENETSAEEAIETGNSVQTDHSTLYGLMPAVIEQLEMAGRLSDFEGILKAVGGGILETNIAFHLLLDIGQFYSNSTVSAMRYSSESLQFWSTVKNLFKGKGINFFRGYKAQGLNENKNAPVKTIDCKINFIVPSDSVLRKESSTYIDDAKEPGVLRTSIESFSREHCHKDVKI